MAVSTRRINTLRIWPIYLIYVAIIPRTSQRTGRKRLHPDFREAHTRAKDIQKNFLVQNGLAKHYESAAFIFVATNLTDMKNRNELTGANGAALNAPAEQPSLEHIPTEQLQQAMELMEQAKQLMEAPAAEAKL